MYVMTSFAGIRDDPSGQVGYWVAVNPQGTFRQASNAISDIQNHAGVTVFLIVDFAFSDIVLIYRHVAFGFGLILIYLAVNAAWTLATNIPIYHVLSWTSTSTAYYVIGTVTIFPVVYLGLAALSIKIRSWDSTTTTTMTTSQKSAPPDLDGDATIAVPVASII